MDWLNFHIPTSGRSPEYIGSSPTERGAWLSVLIYACTIECGGRIPGAANWKDRQWQQAAGVTLDEVRAADRLMRFDGDDLIVNGYPAEAEKQVRKNRKSAKAGGMAKWSKTKAERDAVTMPPGSATSMPPGMPPGNAGMMPPGHAKGEGEGEGEGKEESNIAAVCSAGEPSAPPSMTKSWMDWKLTIGRHRVYIDREGNAEGHWAELYSRTGWDEFTKAWGYCAAKTAKPGGKVFLSNMLEVIS